MTAMDKNKRFILYVATCISIDIWIGFAGIVLGYNVNGPVCLVLCHLATSFQMVSASYLGLHIPIPFQLNWKIRFTDKLTFHCHHILICEHNRPFVLFEI